jgi:glucose 1-dehydrogenase
MKLEGRVALITGANRGIGKGIAMELAREGANVAVNYRSHSDEAEEVADEIRAMGRRAIICQGDVANRDEVDAMVTQTVGKLGRIDIGVANAAHSIRKPFLELTNEDMEETIGVCLMGVFNTMQACAKEMVKCDISREGSPVTDRGNLLVISSVHAFIPFNTCVPYNTCKAGINHMAHTIADELKTHRIRVNVIEPGWIDTPGEREHCSEEEIARLAKELPWGRMGTIEELGRAATYLCSDDASYVTAATLRVDGGIWLPSRGRSSSV